VVPCRRSPRSPSLPAAHLRASVGRPKKSRHIPRLRDCAARGAHYPAMRCEHQPKGQRRADP
jgi:hypothetical protein